MSASKLSADARRRRPRRPACPGKLLVALCRDGAMFSATCLGENVLSDSAKDAVMVCASLAWSRKKKDTVRQEQISAKEIKRGIFETRCFRGAVPAIEPACSECNTPLSEVADCTCVTPGPKPLRKISAGGRHAL